MKTLTLSFLFLVFSLITQASEDKYLALMKENISSLNEAKTIEEMQAVANNFERISNVKQEEWLPKYYLAYTYILMSNIEKKTKSKDNLLDKAQKPLDEALSKNPQESELVALQGFLYIMRLDADPANRGQQMAPKATQTLEQAVAMNQSNPRALLLLGMMIYGTAQFFKSDTKEACGLIEKSVQLFETDQQKSEISPSWGKETALSAQQMCNGTAEQ